MKVDELYADAKRRDSEEVRLGSGWTSAGDPGAAFSLFWLAATGELYALRSGPVAFGPGAPKPMGVYFPRMENEGPEDREVTLLGLAALEDVTTTVGSAGESERTLEWLREHLP